MEDQQSIVIDEFKGLYDRGDTRDINVIQIEPGFFKTLDNYYHQGESLITRPGFATLGVPSTSTTRLLRFWPYHRPGTNAEAWIVLDDNGGTYRVKDSVNNFAIMNLSGANDFQLFLLRNTFVGGEIALDPGLLQPLGTGNLKIYDLTYTPAQAVARDAAGVSPSAAGAMAAATGAAGTVEAGVHLIAVAYETNTGFITPPGVFVAGVYTPTQYTAPGAAKINLTNIPTGPTGTVARHILASKVIRPPFNGDVLVPELFFVPGARIADNIATTLTIDFYDSALVVSADYLLDELELIPAGTSYCVYSNRLIIVGFANVAAPVRGTDPTVANVPINPAYVARVSNVGQFESFSSIEGFIQVAPNEGTALQACWEQNGNLYLAKGDRTYVTRDNGGPPNTWKVDLVDASIGCGPWGVTKLDGTQSTLIEGGAIIGSRRGIYFFTGQYSSQPLTYNIEALYRRNVEDLSQFYQFYYSKFFYDSYRKLLYWLPQTTIGNLTGSQYIMVGACDKGIDPQNIRWSNFTDFNSYDGTNTQRLVKDIYTTSLESGANPALAGIMLEMIFADSTSAIDNNTGDNTEIYAMRGAFGLDAQLSGLGGRIYWELVGFPANVEELDKLQAVAVRVLAKHDNNEDPNDFELGAFDFTYNEFTPTVPQFFGDPRIKDMVLLPQLYDAPIDLRSKLIGIAFNRGERGGVLISPDGFGAINNTVFIHKLIMYGNKAASDKLRGSIR